MVEALSGNWGVLLITLLRFTSTVIPILPGTYCLLISGYLFGLEVGKLIFSEDSNDDDDDFHGGILTPAFQGN